MIQGTLEQAIASRDIGSAENFIRDGVAANPFDPAFIEELKSGYTKYIQKIMEFGPEQREKLLTFFFLSQVPIETKKEFVKMTSEKISLIRSKSSKLERELESSTQAIRDEMYTNPYDVPSGQWGDRVEDAIYVQNRCRQNEHNKDRMERAIELVTSKIQPRIKSLESASNALKSAIDKHIPDQISTSDFESDKIFFRFLEENGEFQAIYIQPTKDQAPRTTRTLERFANIIKTLHLHTLSIDADLIEELRFLIPALHENKTLTKINLSSQNHFSSRPAIRSNSSKTKKQPLSNYREEISEIEERNKALLKGGKSNSHLLFNAGKRFEKRKEYEQARRWYLKAAKQDNAKAQYKLAKMYEEQSPQNPEKALYWYDRAAEQNNPDAQLVLADRLKEDQTNPANLEKAIDLYAKAARQKNEQALESLERLADDGNPIAQHFLGMMYWKGEGVEINHRKAFEYLDHYAEHSPENKEQIFLWYDEASRQNDPNAQYAQFKVARRLEQDQTNDDNLRKAINLYAKAARQSNKRALKSLERLAKNNNPLAQRHLGWMYSKGEGVPVDGEKAIQMYKQSAKQNNSTAQCSLGYIYYNGKHGEKNEKLAKKWWVKGAKNGCQVSQYNLGIMFLKENRSKKAAFYLYSAAIQGYKNAKDKLLLMANKKDKYALYKLAVMYQDGQGFEINQNSSMEFYHEAAKQGHKQALEKLTENAEEGVTIAEYLLGLFFFEGVGIQQDKETGYRWIKKAVKKGNKKAVNWLNKETQRESPAERKLLLARVYAEGRGDIPKDDNMAQIWYHRAASGGNPEAQYEYGMLCSKGRIMNENKNTAKRWFRSAARQGHAKARAEL